MATQNHEDIGALARNLLLCAYDGVLSTQSLEMPGYPFGSVMPYCLDRAGLPVILIADIAQHTKNIRHDSKVSLIVLDMSVADLQANGRITILANAVAHDRIDDDIAERYYRFFPDSRDYHKTHGFSFFRLEPVRIRFIGGFGRIHWLSPEQFVLPNPFGRTTEDGMVAHMNADHGDAMHKYCAAAGLEATAEEIVSMAGIDAEGFHLRVGERLRRFPFPAPAHTPEAVRYALVAMARQS